MAKIQATFYGVGVWRNSSYSPSASAFVNELSRGGWHISNFRVSQAGNGAYEFSFAINDDTTYTHPTFDSFLSFFRNYFSAYFNYLQFSGTNNSTSNSGGGFTGTGLPSGGNSGGGTYTVVRGDTFSKIAARFGMSVAQLSALNPQVTNINVISVGQVLRVSGAAQQTIPVVTNITGSGNPVIVQQPVNNPVAPKPPATGTFSKIAGDIGISVGVLGVLGAVAAVVILKSR